MASVAMKGTFMASRRPALAELGDLGAVRFAGDRIHGVPGFSPGHPVRDDLYALVLESPAEPVKHWIRGKSLGSVEFPRSAARNLVAHGVLDEQPGPRWAPMWTRWAVVDPRPRRELRSRLDAVLRGSAQPTRSEILLIVVHDSFSLREMLFPRFRRRQPKKVIRAIRRDHAPKGTLLGELARLAEQGKWAFEDGGVPSVLD